MRTIVGVADGIERGVLDKLSPWSFLFGWACHIASAADQPQLATSIVLAIYFKEASYLRTSLSNCSASSTWIALSCRNSALLDRSALQPDLYHRQSQCHLPLSYAILNVAAVLFGDSGAILDLPIEIEGV